MAYVKYTWDTGVGGATPISKDNLNHLETQYDESITLVHKTADETVNNSIVLQNDDELLFAMAANEVWFITLITYMNSSAVADAVVTYVLPALAVGGDVVQYWDGDGTRIAGGVNFGASSLTILGGGAQSRVNSWWHILVINGANAGNFQVQWAQNVAEATDTKMLIGSCLFAHQIV